MSVTSNCYAKDLSCLGQPSLGVGYQSCSTSATSTDVITYTLSCTVNALSQCVFGYGSDYTYYNGYSKYFPPEQVLFSLPLQQSVEMELYQKLLIPH